VTIETDYYSLSYFESYTKSDADTMQLTYFAILSALAGGVFARGQDVLKSSESQIYGQIRRSVNPLV
jgi:hypothetical protein